ncbi:MAG: hypothetical protein WB697_12840 [Stellaceae bacterium]
MTFNEDAISPGGRAAISEEDNEIFVSAASIWEIAIKYNTGKLPGATHLMVHLENAVLDEGFGGMPVHFVTAKWPVVFRCTIKTRSTAC